MSSIDDTGLTIVTRDQVLAQLIADFQGIYGSDIDVTEASPDGRWLRHLASEYSASLALLDTVYGARSPSSARGAGLSRLALLGGVIRKGPSFSIAAVVLSGTPGAVVPAGALIASDEPEGPIFQTTTELKIGIGGTVAGQARAQVVGPVTAGAGHLVTIQTVVSGWSGVTNPSAAVPGTLMETDGELRARRAKSVAMPSQSILDGLFAGLDQLAGVQHLVVYENAESTPKALKGGSLIGHAIQAIIDGGEAPAIGQALWTRRSLGCTLVGTETFDVTDLQGNVYTMRWDRPVDVTIYLRVQLAVDVDEETRGAIQVAIEAWGNASAKIGEDVIWSQIFIPINATAEVNVTAIFVGSAPSPAVPATNVVVNFNQIPRWNVANIAVGL